MKDAWMVFADSDGEVFCSRSDAMDRVSELISEGTEAGDIRVYRASEEYSVKAEIELVIKKI